MSERYRVVASFDGWGQAGVYIGDTRFCVAPSKENAERIAAALNSVEGIATQSNAQAGVVEARVAVPPADCRARLRAEGKPYPRSGCQACGKWYPRSDYCEAVLAAVKGPLPEPPKVKP